MIVKLIYEQVMGKIKSSINCFLLFSIPLMCYDDVQIVSRIRLSRVKSSSCILILRIVKNELSCTGVVPATEPLMPKLEWVTQEKLCLVCVSVFVCLYVFLTPLPSGASVYIYLQAFSSFVRWNIKGDIHSLFVTSPRWAIGELSFQRQ